MSEHGKEAVVAILNEGQLFGEGCLDDQRLRTASTIAMPDCRITSIAKSVMLTAIRDQPQFSDLFMDHLLSRNSRIQEDVIDQLFNSSEKRLARLLLLLANYGKEGSPRIAPVTISQDPLACDQARRQSLQACRFPKSRFQFSPRAYKAPSARTPMVHHEGPLRPQALQPRDNSHPR
jgi:CRP-like cAMP-binding protein